MKLLGFTIAGAFALASMVMPAFAAPDDVLTIQLKDGPVVIQLMPEVAPKHVAQVEALAAKGAYDNVVFHRVIDGFMAQTGDVQFGKEGGPGYNPGRAGTGGSDLPDLPAEFSKVPFERGTVGMARAQSPNSANSQFFIMFDQGSFLNGQYTVIGKVVSGMEFVDKIKRGEGRNGEVTNPDKMIKVTVGKK
ncbi:peptidylprolyl isomerase [Rhizobium sp. YS-1r]|uniref:Peptidyl-prolyl cis-trans isomerase n=1 Tax=Neorhizobium phenanthreniclasticum TaxID=3157917 RepID=A0ABV0M195_9HYPH|nr:peptidylprolyl isomerase [Rhizobium sp. YS-1r]KGE00550.1 peptidylprolyl isomerase [Rhizobium sp. YS-1r]